MCSVSTILDGSGLLTVSECFLPLKMVNGRSAKRMDLERIMTQNP